LAGGECWASVAWTGRIANTMCIIDNGKEWLLKRIFRKWSKSTLVVENGVEFTKEGGCDEEEKVS